MNDNEIRTYVDRQRIEDVVTRLFLLTDKLDWVNLREKCLDEEVIFDMSSLTGEAVRKVPAKEITDGWEAGLRPLESVHHQMGNLLISFTSGDHAIATCYATAIHYLPNEKGGSTRTYVGSYELGMARTVHGWRIESFKYISKFVMGNLELGR